MSMTTLIIFLLVIVGVGIYIWQMYRTRKKIEQPTEYNPLNDQLSLENVGPGGMIRLMNVGKNMDEYDVNILSKSIYREGENYEWYELEGDNGRSKIWISLERDDELEVTIATRKLKLRDLSINRSDLDDMDEKKEGQFVFEGKIYHYENSNEASYFRNGVVSQDNEEFFYYWEFETADGDEFITIEEWENGKFEVTVSYSIKESQVKVYSLGGVTI